MTAQARRKAGIKGLSNIRLALRNAPDAIRKDVAQTIEALATEVEQVERYFAPRDEGDLVTSITHVTSSDGLSAVIGPGIRGATTIKKRVGSFFGTRSVAKSTGKVLKFSQQTQFDRFQMIKAYWLEVGTKKMRRHPFVEPTFDSMKGKILKGVSTAVDLGLSRVLGR